MCLCQKQHYKFYWTNTQNELIQHNKCTHQNLKCFQIKNQLCSSTKLVDNYENTTKRYWRVSRILQNARRTHKINAIYQTRKILFFRLVCFSNFLYLWPIMRPQQAYLAFAGWWFLRAVRFDWRIFWIGACQWETRNEISRLDYDRRGYCAKETHHLYSHSLCFCVTCHLVGTRKCLRLVSAFSEKKFDNNYYRFNIKENIDMSDASLEFVYHRLSTAIQSFYDTI